MVPLKSLNVLPERVKFQRNFVFCSDVFRHPKYLAVFWATVGNVKEQKKIPKGQAVVNQPNALPSFAGDGASPQACPAGS